jgi:hypothetical protein
LGTEAFWTVSNSDLQRIVDAAVHASDRKAAELVRAHTLRMSLVGALVLFSAGIFSFGAGLIFRSSACAMAGDAIPRLEMSNGLAH